MQRDLTEDPVVGPNVVEDTLKSFQKLKGYHSIQHEEKLRVVLTRLRTIGVISPDNPAYLPFSRITTYLKTASAEEAYQILCFIDQDLGSITREQKSNSTSSTTFQLLDICPNSLDHLLNLTQGDKKNADEQKAILDISDLGTRIAPPRDAKAANTKLVAYDPTEPCSKQKKDHPMQVLQQRLQQKQVYADSQGYAYHWERKLEVGASSPLMQGRETTIVSLDTGLNFQLLHHYIFICEMLSRGGPAKFLQNVAEYSLPAIVASEPIDNLKVKYGSAVTPKVQAEYGRIITQLLIDPRHQAQYAPLLERLSPKYIVSQHQQLNVLLAKGELCTAILSEKKASSPQESLSQAFASVLPEQMRTLLADHELFLLLIFHYQKKSDFIQSVWPVTPGFISPLQQVITDLAANGFGQSFQSRLHPALKRIIPQQAPLQLMEMMCELPNHFEPEFVCRFAIEHIQNPRDKKRFLVKLFEKNSSDLNAQLIWIRSFKDLEFQKKIIQLLMSYGVPIDPSVQASLPSAPPSDDFKSGDAPSLGFQLSLDRPSAPAVPNAYLSVYPSIADGYATPNAPAAEGVTYEPSAPDFADLKLDDPFEELDSGAAQAQSPLAYEQPVSTTDQATRPTSQLLASAGLPLDSKSVAPPVEVYHPEKLLFLLKKRSSSNIVRRAQDELEKYRQTFLAASITKDDKEIPNPTLIKDAENCRQRKTAFFFLCSSFETNDPNWSNFNNTCRESEFKTAAGYYNSDSLLASLGASTDSLWRVVAIIQTKIQKQAKFYQEFRDPRILAQLFYDDRYWDMALNTQDLILIFKHSNPAAFIDAMLQFNRFKLVKKILPDLSTDARREFYQQLGKREHIQLLFKNATLFSLLTKDDLFHLFEHGDQATFIECMVRHNRFPIPEAIQRIIHSSSAQQKPCFEPFSDETLLAQAIRTSSIFLALSAEDLAQIYHHSNKELFLTLIRENGRLATWKPIQIQTNSGVFELTAQHIEKILDPKDLDGANTLRKQLNLPLVIPPGYVRAGLDGLLDGVEMTPELAYQLADTDLHNMDVFLIQKYHRRGVLCNPVDCQASEVKFGEVPDKEAKAQKEPNVLFYHIPANIQPILTEIDFRAAEVEHFRLAREELLEKEAKANGRPIPPRAPKNAKGEQGLMTYRFLTKVQGIVNSYDRSKTKKSVIFTVWLNTGKNHYVPCLIFKPLVGKIQIITDNPSPETTLPEQQRGPTSKDKIDTLIHTMFSHVFPGCEHRDLKQTKQIRQRDCGFRTATDFEDLFESATTEHPIVEVVANKLVVHPERFSISFNAQPWRIKDFKRGVYLYSQEAANVAARDRQKWATRLDPVSHVNYFVLNENPSFTTPLILQGGIEELEEYSYHDNVLRQEHTDRLGELRSRIVMLLLGVDGLPPPDEMVKALRKRNLVSKFSATAAQVDEFKRTRRLPEFKDMSLYVQALREGFDDFQKNQGEKAQTNPVDELIAIGRELGADAGDLATPEQYLQSLLIDNLKPHYPEVILSGLDSFIQTYVLRDDKERPNDLVQAYFKSDVTARERFQELRSSDQRRASELNQQLLKKAEAIWSIKISHYYQSIVEEAFRLNLVNILKSLSAHALPDSKELNRKIVFEFKQNKHLATAFAYLESHQAALLERTLSDAISRIVKPYGADTWRHLTTGLNACNLATLPKPLHAKLSVLQPEFSALLPSAADLYKPNPIRDAGDSKESGRERRPNILGLLIAAQIDGTPERSPLTTYYDQKLDHLLKDNTRTQLTQVDFVRSLTAMSTAELNAIMTSDEYAQRIAAAPPLNLFASLSGLESQRAFYCRAIDYMTRAFRNQIKETLAARLCAIYEFILNHYHLIKVDQLQSIFLNMESSPPDVTLREVISQLNRLEQGYIDHTVNPPVRQPVNSLTHSEKNILKGLIGLQNKNTLTIFTQLYANDLVNKLQGTQTPILQLASQVNRYEKLFGQIKIHLIQNPTDEMIESFSTIKLRELSAALQDCRFLPYSNIHDRYREYETEFRATFDRLIKLLLSEIRNPPGNITPNHNANAARLFLCQLLDIKPQPSRYLTGEQALKYDMDIEQSYKNLSRPPIPQEFKAIHPPYSITPVATAPNLCGKRLTPHMLAQLAANWLCSYDEAMLPGKKIPSDALNTLFTALNNLPPECRAREELSDEWCTKHIKPLLDSPRTRHEMQPGNKAEPFLFALMNCGNFSSAKSQIVESADDQVNISHLDEIMALYQRQQGTAQLTKYITSLSEEFTLPETSESETNETESPDSERKTAESPDPERKQAKRANERKTIPTVTLSTSIFQRGRIRGLLGNSSDIDFFADCISQIRRRHGESNSRVEFALNEGDIQILRNFLSLRWERLVAASRPALPTNYLHLGKAGTPTDNICLLIAKLIKNALHNLGSEIEFEELLMPANVPICKLVGKDHKRVEEVKVPIWGSDDPFRICPDDVFSLRNAIALPDGRWLPKDYFVELYKRGEGLRDFFNNKPLTQAEVKHIVDHYPDVAEKLAPQFAAKYSNPFTDDIVDKFLGLIQNLDLRTFVAYPPKNSPEYTRSEAAEVALESYINNLPEGKRAILYTIHVPGTDGTLRKYFTMSKREKEATCVSQYTLRLALTLWANRPDIPVGKFEPLYGYQYSNIKIKDQFEAIPRVTKAFTITSALSSSLDPAERPILEFYLEQQRQPQRVLRA